MYCKRDEEMIDGVDSCDECGDNEECSYYREGQEKRAEIKKMRNSKFIKEVEKTLSSTFKIPQKELSPILDSLTNNIFDTSMNYMRTLIQEEVKILQTKYFDKKMKSLLNKTFNTVLESKVIELKKNGTPLITSIQEKILEKFKDYFRNDEEWNGREDEIDKIIKNLVNKKTEKAIAELKKETIEKFNIEAMKTMMKGMAKQLGSDKKLMKILTSGDFDDE